MGDHASHVGKATARRMKLGDFMVREAINRDLRATTKEGAFREIVRCLRYTGQLEQIDIAKIVRQFMVREELGSTGIGDGVAVPYTRHPGVDRVIGTVALSRRGVEYDALDCEPVHVFFMLVSSPKRPGDHLQALEAIGRFVRRGFVDRLHQAETREQIIALLEEADREDA